MEAASERLSLIFSGQDVAEIQVLCDVASANGTYLHLKEAISLLYPDASEQEFLEAWSKASSLSERFEIRSGVITNRNENMMELMESYVEDRRRRADRNLEYASKFVRLDGGQDVRVFSVSGSTSYGSVSEQDDLDFFCITQKDSMWLFLTRSLLFARVFRFLNGDSPDLCFCCNMDEGFAEQLFHERRDALFARDALKVHVIQGSKFYNNLLRINSWISRYFPELYRAKVAPNAIATTLSSNEEPNIVMKVANLFLYGTVGNYLRLKANLRKRRLAREGVRTRLVSYKIGKDCCIYESGHYLELKHLYARLSTTERFVPWPSINFNSLDDSVVSTARAEQTL